MNIWAEIGVNLSKDLDHLAHERLEWQNRIYVADPYINKALTPMIQNDIEPNDLMEDNKKKKKQQQI